MRNFIRNKTTNTAQRKHDVTQQNKTAQRKHDATTKQQYYKAKQYNTTPQNANTTKFKKRQHKKYKKHNIT